MAKKTIKQARVLGGFELDGIKYNPNDIIESDPRLIKSLGTSVDVGYDDGGLKFTFGQSIRKVLRKIKDTGGRPIWTPSYDAGIANRSPDQLLGYDTQINNHMPVPAANAKSIAFGQFKKYVIRDAMQITLFRFDDSAFAKKGQVGFLAWIRSGGNLTDTASVKLYQHSAT